MSFDLESLRLTLPFPPSVNNYKTVGAIVKTKSGKLFQQRNNSIQTKEFYWEVYSIVKAQIGFKTPKSYLDSTIRLEIYIELSAPSERPYDVDNRLKVLLDSLQRAGAIANDEQIQKLTVIKKPIIAGGQAIVMIKEYKE